jgi:hypothetical protein
MQSYHYHRAAWRPAYHKHLPESTWCTQCRNIMGSTGKTGRSLAAQDKDQLAAPIHCCGQRDRKEFKNEAGCLELEACNAFSNQLRRASSSMAASSPPWPPTLRGSTCAFFDLQFYLLLPAALCTSETLHLTLVGRIGLCVRQVSWKGSGDHRRRERDREGDGS